MNRIKNQISLIVMTLLALLTFGACNHKDLCYHHVHEVKIKLEYDWRYAPEAYPAGMVAYFYPEDREASPIRIDFNGRDGGYISIPTGRYKIISYNNDTEASQFDKTDLYDEHRAYTRQGHVLEPVTGPGDPQESEGERVVVCPDDIFGCTAIDVEITEDGISYICVPWEEIDDYVGRPVITDEQLIVLYPHDLLCHYSYEIRNVDGLDRVEQLCASLSGMSPSLTVAAENLHELPVTLPLAGYGNTEDNTIRGEFLTFGHHDSNVKDHKMLLYLWMKSGKKYLVGSNSENFNVTRQVDDAPNRRRVHIIIDGLKIPADDNDDDPPGFFPSTDEWFEVNTEIEI